jgi:xylose isomerase
VGLIQTKLRDKRFWGVNPELTQHEGMTLLDAVSCVKFLVSCGKLFFLHFGNQIKGQFDNDFPPLVGPEHLKETVEMFRVLTVLGWQGVVEFDCHMLRCEADPEAAEACRKQFIRNCSTALTITLELAERLQGLDVSGMEESEADLVATMAMTGLDPAEVARKTRRGAA